MLILKKLILKIYKVKYKVNIKKKKNQMNAGKQIKDF